MVDGGWWMIMVDAFYHTNVTDLGLALQGPEAGGRRGGEELLHQHGLLPPQEAVPPLPHQLTQRR